MHVCDKPIQDAFDRHLEALHNEYSRRLARGEDVEKLNCLLTGLYRLRHDTTKEFVINSANNLCVYVQVPFHNYTLEFDGSKWFPLYRCTDLVKRKIPVGSFVLYGEGEASNEGELKRKAKKYNKQGIRPGVCSKCGQPAPIYRNFAPIMCNHCYRTRKDGSK